MLLTTVRFFGVIDANDKATRQSCAGGAVCISDTDCAQLPAALAFCVSAPVSCTDLSFACMLTYHV